MTSFIPVCEKGVTWKKTAKRVKSFPLLDAFGILFTITQQKMQFEMWGFRNYVVLEIFPDKQDNSDEKEFEDDTQKPVALSVMLMIV